MYLRGDISSWKAQGAYKFNCNESTGEYSLTLTSLNGQFKIAQEDWNADNIGSTKSNDGDEVITSSMSEVSVSNKGKNFKADNLQNVTITFTLTKSDNQYVAKDGKIYFSYEEENTGGSGNQTVTYPDMYLMGANYGNWNADESYKFTRTDNNYTLTVSSLSGQFKIADRNWTVNLGSNGKNHGDVKITESCTQSAVHDGKNFGCDGLSNVTISFSLTAEGSSFTYSDITFTVPSTGGGETGGGNTDKDTFTVYFDNSNMSWSNVMVYWYGSKTHSNPGWGSGNTMNAVSGHTNLYTYEVPKDVNFFLFYNGTSGFNNQVNNITNKTDGGVWKKKNTTSQDWEYLGLFSELYGGGTGGGGEVVVPGERCDNIRPGCEPSRTLPILYINVYKENANGDKVYDDAIIDRDLRDKNYRTGEYWLDMNGCQWLIDAGGADLGSADAPLPLEIKARGNYTRTGFSKKPYKLKLGKKQSMLGMTPSKSKHWALIAHADDDKGFLRNYIGFNLAHRIGLNPNADSPGAWSPSQQPVEVVINGDYRGLYFLTESIRVGDGRVNIQELKDGETDRSLISGGYLIELDNYDESDETQIDVFYKKGIYNEDIYHHITFDSPEVYSDIQRQFVTDQFVTMNNLIINNNNDMWKYIDLDDAVRYYLTYEITSHWEAYHGSTYMFRDRGAGQKWHFSPVWDFGNAFGGDTNKFFYDGSQYGNTWIPELRSNTKFNNRLIETWKWFMANCYEGLINDIDTYVGHISAAAVSDAQRWNGVATPPRYNDPMNNNTLTNPTPVCNNSDMTLRRNTVVSHLNAKIDWLKRQWGDYTNDTFNEPSRDTTPAAPLPDYASADYVPTYIYVKNNKNWENIYAYLYNSNTDSYTAWPGVKITDNQPDLICKYNGTEYRDLWRIEIPYYYRGAKVIISDGTGTNKQDNRYPLDGANGVQITNGKNVFFITGTNTLAGNIDAKDVYYYQPPFSGTLPVLYINTTDNAAVQYGTDVAGTFWVDPLESGAAGVGTRDEQLALNIKGRGSSSWGLYEKKSYKLSLDKKAAFGDMPKSKHWVLMSYVDDAANGLLTNYAGHEVAKALKMKWTPGMEPVEVVLNGEYIGLYFIVENIRPAKDRVAVNDTDDKTYDAENDWILEFDCFATDEETKYSWTANEKTYKVVPSHPEITSDDDELQGYLNTAVDNLRSYMPTGQGDNAWLEYIDLAEAGKFYIVQEVMDCNDAFSNSFYMHHTTGSKWFFGPVWDFGASMASEGGKNALIHNQGIDGVVFLKDLYDNVYFKNYVIETFLDNLNGGTAATEPSSAPKHAPRASNGKFDEVIANVEAMAEKIAPAAAKDAVRWPDYAATSESNPLSARATTLTNGINANIDYLAKSTEEDGAGWTRENIVTGVSISATDNNAKPEYFDLTGNRISQPVKGQLYIVRRGSKVTKQICR